MAATPEVPAAGAFVPRAKKVKNKPGEWDSLDVSIVRVSEDGSDERLGGYRRNYHALFHTFAPFVKNGRIFALYSRDYMHTRVMSLPECQDLGGEDDSNVEYASHFCPVDYWVAPDATFGFVAGCIWGDDSSWKVQYLDLGRVEEGVIKRDARLGYLELPEGAERLADAIDFMMEKLKAAASVGPPR